MEDFVKSLLAYLISALHSIGIMQMKILYVQVKHQQPLCIAPIYEMLNMSLVYHTEQGFREAFYDLPQTSISIFFLNVQNLERLFSGV